MIVSVYELDEEKVQVRSLYVYYLIIIISRYIKRYVILSLGKLNYLFVVIILLLY